MKSVSRSPGTPPMRRSSTSRQGRRPAWQWSARTGECGKGRRIWEHSACGVTRWWPGWSGDEPGALAARADRAGQPQLRTDHATVRSIGSGVGCETSGQFDLVALLRHERPGWIEDPHGIELRRESRRPQDAQVGDALSSHTQPPSSPASPARLAMILASLGGSGL